MEQVNWKSYAQAYDMLMVYNPFYQQLHKEVLSYVEEWDIPEGATIADLGAGTGNYSLAIASKFPKANVLHIDNNEGMNARTTEKRMEMGLDNHRILDQSIEEVDIQPGSLDALISIHALYAFPNPQEVLKKAFSWLKPGAPAILVDAGRIVNVLDWQLAIGWHLLRQHGLRKSLKIISEGKIVSRQNAKLREMQRNGVLWTHSHEEFVEAVHKAGFEVKSSHITFRGISDCVITKKAKVPETIQ